MKASIHETTEINGCFENSLEISAENAKKDWKFVKNWKITKKEKIHEKTRIFIKSQQCIEIRCIHEKSMWKLVYSWKIRCIHELIIQYSMETLGLALGLYKKLDIMRLFKKNRAHEFVFLLSFQSTYVLGIMFKRKVSLRNEKKFFIARSNRKSIHFYFWIVHSDSLRGNKQRQ